MYLADGNKRQILYFSWGLRIGYDWHCAGMAKLADAPDLGSGAARRGGSSPSTRTKMSMSSLNFRIRPAMIAEKEVLQELIAASARALSAEYDREETEAAIHYIFGVDSEVVEDGTYYVVEREEELLACGGWSRRRTLFGGDQYQGRKSGLLNPQTEPAKIRAFFVHPNAARQGIGSSLLAHCEAEAKRHGFSRIEMMATLPGVKLYEKFGYEPGELEYHTVPDGRKVRFVPMIKSLI